MVSNDIDANNNLGMQRFSHLKIPTKYQYSTDFTNWVGSLIALLLLFIIPCIHLYTGLTLEFSSWSKPNTPYMASLGVHVQKLDLKGKCLPGQEGQIACKLVSIHQKVITSLDFRESSTRVTIQVQVYGLDSNLPTLCCVSLRSVFFRSLIWT
jgi:hypothetical protein